MKHYPEVESSPSFSAIEERVLQYWRDERIFEESVTRRSGAEDYVFYDGPPFANGLPHYGHLVTGYVKDVVPRYQTMRGRHVPRRFGWDCHGLPAELEGEKQLGISGRHQILEYGMQKFNDFCRQSVQRYTEEWQEIVHRQARWVDFENDYKTMDLPYMESVLWAFAELYRKGLVYEGTRVLPYSWAVETPVSNFETRIDNAYRERQDPALTVRFRLRPRSGDPGPLDVLAWTTTPWTLPSNLALAVGPEIEYAIVAKDGAYLVLAGPALGKYAKELGEAERIGTVRGAELVDREYEPLFPFFADTRGAFRILGADFVDTTEGTGVVHMAPGFGEDDHTACERAGIPVVCPVDGRGRFTQEVEPYAGQLVFDANKPIIRDLKERGVVLRHETYVHNYPHCWRTDEPLIYKAISSWFVKVTAFRERMVELNRDIHWIPEHVRDGSFGKWLAGARDWSISRNRFWGTPLPVWKSDDPRHPRVDVYGSLEELERDFGVRVEDLHRPGIDELTRPNPDDPSGASTMRRVEEVFDCWFESGSMPFAQVHYPFEQREWFEAHFPADFIVEYIAQTRGWFYTMMVLSTALFDRPPFRHCICHGVVLDAQNQKLSKRLRNYPDPQEVFQKYGADALRWYMIASPILRGQNLSIDKDGKAIGEVVRQVINPLWNAYSFFCLYANADGIQAQWRADSEGLLDRYLLAKTGELVRGVTERMDAYDIPGACAAVTAFLDAMNNWYIRRSRSRFWAEEASSDKQAAHDTLYTVLTTLLRVMAPLAPLLSEEIHRGLTRERSVHLVDWPDPETLPREDRLVEEMDDVRAICSAGLAVRKENDLTVRQPLRRLTVAGGGVERLAAYDELIRDELNVKEVVYGAELEELGHFVLTVNARVVGPRLGKRMQDVMKAAKQGEWRAADEDRVEVAGEILGPDEFELRLVAREGLACQALPGNRTLVALDTELDDELRDERFAREIVRRVQQTRKDAGLHVSDRIALHLEVGPARAEAIERHRDWICEQTLAVEFALGAGGEHRQEFELLGERAVVGVAKRSA